ncbi:MAG: ATP-binding protein [Dysgonamonadaceae bacterium]|nr:ATP-binding protein [Dysgonamonadaceae bacterium]
MQKNFAIMALQNLPIGIQSFEDLRSNNYLYVDKTEYIYNLVTTGKPYFLSRPRRFGKSLLISTFDCLFSGRKELFEGLYMYDKWDWTKTNPVIRFDFGSQNYQNAERLEEDLIAKVNEYAAQYEIELSRTWPARFAELIEKIHKKTGEKIVVLVDEYDKAIIDHLKEMELADQIRIALHNFYQILKAVDDHLRFVFLTGVSKFSRISIFSGLNNLNDLTMSDKYAAVCGYTQEELLSYFDSYIEELAISEAQTKDEIIKQIKDNYDGYSWDGKTFVYNPFSTLKLFNEKKFIDYWFESGTPTFLVDLIKQRNDIQLITKPFPLAADAFNAYDIQNIDTKLLLFQTGYLTVKSIRKNPFSNSLTYLLDIPNQEVRTGLMTHLLAGFSENSIPDTTTLRDTMMEQLFNGDTAAFNRNLKAMIAHIPYQLHIPEESYYHSLFILWLKMLGFKVDAEVSTNTGRIDAVWTWGDRVVIAEVKYTKEGNLDTLISEAFTQIREKKYYERYNGENKRIALLAVAFAGREITSQMEEL